MKIIEFSVFESIIIYFIVMLIALMGIHIAKKSSSVSKQRIYLWFVICLLSVISFFRYDVGIDYYVHFNISETMQGMPDITYAMAYWGRLEPSFGAISYLFGKWGLGPECVIGLYGILTQCFFVYAIWNYRKYVNPTILMLIYLCTFYFQTFNMFRQSLSVSIMFFSFIYLINGKNLKFYLMVLLATVFHKSAIVCFIMPFVYKNAKRNKLFDRLLTYVAPGIIVLFFESIMQLAVYVPLLRPYITETANYTTSNDGSILSLGMLLYVIEVTIYIYYRKKRIVLDNKNMYNVFFDKCMFYEGLRLIVNLTVGFASRIILYFSFPSMLSLATIYNRKELSNTNLRKMTIGQCFVILYCLALLIRILINNGYGQLPYKIWLI